MIKTETIEDLWPYWQDPRRPLTWNCLFVTPPWLKAWWQTFAETLRPHVLTLSSHGVPLGVAPLCVLGDVARIIGHEDVCDYLDCVVAPGRELLFYEILLRHLRSQGLRRLEFCPLRPDATVITHMLPVARKLDCRVTCQQMDVTVEVALPPTWEEFLHQLSGKQRHEIRRKLRRLHEAAAVNYRVFVNFEAVVDAQDLFLQLFKINRADKAAFMGARMAAFFRAMIPGMARAGLVQICVLELDGMPAAAVLCFDDQSATYLYNNGYDRRFQPLSVGLLSKIYSIQEAIRSGRQRYDFLKGDEVYKKRLGGRPLPLYRCLIDLV